MKRTATLITGAAGGLGSACVRMAQNLDTEIVIATDFSTNVLTAFSDFKNVISYTLDVTSEAAIRELKKKLEQENISVKYLINNAGVFDYFPISEATADLLDKTLKVNTYGPILMVSNFISDLAENKGRVVQISSVSVKLPVLFMPYPNSKIALEAFSTSMRQELSLLGVDLILIRPGAMDTNLISSMKDIQNPIPNSRYATYFNKFTDTAKKEVGKMVHPDKVATLIQKALLARKPRRIYSINKNNKIAIVLMFPLRMRDWLITSTVKK